MDPLLLIYKSILLLLFYSFIVIVISSTNYLHLLINCQPNFRFNNTEDLTCDTLFISSTSNLTPWSCFLDNQNQIDYFNNNNNNNNYSSCFLNVICSRPYSALVNENEETQISLPETTAIFWLKCYDLHNDSLLKDFIQKSPKNLILSSKKDLSKCSQYDETKPSTISFKADFIRCNKDNVFDFLKAINKYHKYYVVESLGIQESNLTEVPSWIFEEFEHLKSINLTSNKLTEFDLTDSITRKENLVTIDLSKNNLVHLNLTVFPYLRSINLFQNNLTTLSRKHMPESVINLLENLKKADEKTLLEFNIGNNNWNCNEDIDWLINLISVIVETNGHSYFFETNGQQKRVDLFRTNEPECEQPPEAKMFPFSLWKSVQESPICKLCNCHFQDKHAKAGYRYLIVNCTHRNLMSLPTKLPKNTKILDLSNNHIRNLDPIRKSHGQLFMGDQIFLSNNSLESLDGLEFVRSIVALNIAGNMLKEIPYHIISRSKIDQLWLGNNPYTCDCDTVKMQKWLQNSYRIIGDIRQVRCGYLRPELAKNESNLALVERLQSSKFYLKEILHIDRTQLCPSGHPIDILDVINILLAVSIIFLIIKVTYDFFWQKRTGKLPRFFKLNI